MRIVDVLNRGQKLAMTGRRPTVGPGLGRECAALAIEYIRLEREASQMWLWNRELVANAEALGRRENERHQILSPQIEGEEVKRLSPEQISQHIGARKIFKALCFRLGFVLRPSRLRRLD